MNEHEEELISGGLDDELEGEDRERLANLSSQGNEHASRARSFRRVDEGLRSLGLHSISEEHLEVSLASLRERLAFGRSGSGTHDAEADAVERNDVVALATRWGLSSAFAAAAALALYLSLSSLEPALVPLPELAEVAVTELAEASDARGEVGTMGAMGEELMFALGYGDEASELNAISNEDLDVIERLDLLDFLSARDPRERG